MNVLHAVYIGNVFVIIYTVVDGFGVEKKKIPKRGGYTFT